MADEPGAERLDEQEEEEGGPVKSFLEHLEDLRWVLIKSLAATGVAFVVCLLAGNQVVQLLKRPLEKAKISYPGTNQVVLLFFGTNQLGTFPLTPQEQATLQLGTNRLVAVRVEPATLGTNQVLTWRIDNDADLAARAQKLKIDLLSLGPAQGFLIAFQVAVYFLFCGFVCLSSLEDAGKALRLSRTRFRDRPFRVRCRVLLYFADAHCPGRLPKIFPVAWFLGQPMESR